VSDDDSVILFPLQSNGYGLLAGAPVEAVRRRLKFASVMYEDVLLEAGSFVVEAGPAGTSAYWLDEAKDRFQTSRERRLATERSLVVGRRTKDEPRTDPAPRPSVESETSVSWHSTFFPFMRELPSSCDWLHFVYGDPGDEARQLAADWTIVDLSNAPLEAQLPVPFVRDLLVQNANYDLALGAADDIPTSIDSLHRKVLASRFSHGGCWAGRGFSIPFLFPEVGRLDWSAVGDLRRNKHMRSFRAVMLEVEAEALSEASDGDLKAASHHAYERLLADAFGPLEGLLSLGAKGATGLMIGTGVGFATVGLAGPLGVVAGASLGALIDVVRDAPHLVRQRKRLGWTAVAQSLARAKPSRANML